MNGILSFNLKPRSYIWEFYNYCITVGYICRFHQCVEGKNKVIIKNFFCSQLGIPIFWFYIELIFRVTKWLWLSKKHHRAIYMQRASQFIDWREKWNFSRTWIFDTSLVNYSSIIQIFSRPQYFLFSFKGFLIHFPSVHFKYSGCLFSKCLSKLTDALWKQNKVCPLFFFCKLTNIFKI